MDIFTSPKAQIQWSLGNARYRLEETNLQREMQAIADKLKLPCACVSTTASGATTDVSFSLHLHLGSYDFGWVFTDHCREEGITDAIYVERDDRGKALFCRVANGVLVSDGVCNIDEVGDFLESSAADDSVSLALHHQCLDGELGNYTRDHLTANIQQVEQPLSDALTPEQHHKFQTIGDSLKVTTVKKTPWLVYGIAAIILMVIVNGVFNGAEKQDGVAATSEGSEYAKGVDSIADVPQDPYQTWYAALDGQMISVYNRMAQDYNAHVALIGLGGWEITQVTHTKGQVSYSARALYSGNFDRLRVFSRSIGMYLMVSPTETAIVGRGANRTAWESTGEMIDVEWVHHVLSDRFNAWLPDTQIVFIRDIPQSTGEGSWVIRELNLQFSGLHKEDLLTIGALTQDLPISFGGDLSNASIGSYSIAEERLSGNFTISVYGGRS